MGVPKPLPPRWRSPCKLFSNSATIQIVAKTEPANIKPRCSVALQHTHHDRIVSIARPTAFALVANPGCGFGVVGVVGVTQLPPALFAKHPSCGFALGPGQTRRGRCRHDVGRVALAVDAPGLPAIGFALAMGRLEPCDQCFATRPGHDFAVPTFGLLGAGGANDGRTFGARPWPHVGHVSPGPQSLAARFGGVRAIALF